VEYKISGQINLDEYCQFRKALRGKFFTRKTIIHCCIIVAAIIISIYFINDGLKRHSNILIVLINSIELIIILAMGFIALLMFLIGFLSDLKLKITKNERRDFELDKEIRKKYDYEITQDNIVIYFENKKNILGKKNISEIIFDADSIYIIDEKYKAYIIKKRYFNTEELFGELRLFLKEHYFGGEIQKLNSA